MITVMTDRIISQNYLYIASYWAHKALYFLKGRE